jgi:hypothetical protein
MRHPAVLLSLLLLLPASACTPARTGDAARNPDVLTEEEIRASGARNAYELVEQLRPRWLREGPDRSLRLETVILVYYDGVRLGGLDTLRDLPLDPIRRMHVLGSAQAGTLPGLGSQHVERVIMVLTSPRS